MGNDDPASRFQLWDVAEGQSGTDIELHAFRNTENETLVQSDVGSGVELVHIWGNQVGQYWSFNNGQLAQKFSTSAFHTMLPGST